MKILAFLVVVLFCTSCVTKSASSFSPIEHKSYFVLDNDVFHTTKVASGLGKGKYLALFQDTDFVYYLGPEKSLILNNNVRVNGGIALPKSSSTKQPHFFIEIGDDSEEVRKMKTGWLIEKLAAAEAGRIRNFGLEQDPQCFEYLKEIKIVQE